MRAILSARVSRSGQSICHSHSSRLVSPRQTSTHHDQYYICPYLHIFAFPRTPTTRACCTPQASLHRERRMNSAAAGDGRSWWNVRWSRSGAFRKERKHLVILSVLAGLVFFGAGLLGGTSRATAPEQPTSAGSFSATSKVDSVPPGQRNPAVETGLAAATNVAADGGEPSGDLKVHLYNFYTKDNDIELYPWEHVAEPYTPTTMEVLDWPATSDNLEYR